jgi:hypothetical protein
LGGGREGGREGTSISSSAQYVTLIQIKLKLGLQRDENLLIANHMDESL